MFHVKHSLRDGTPLACGIGGDPWTFLTPADEVILRGLGFPGVCRRGA